jgi:hypothetical protein
MPTIRFEIRGAREVMQNLEVLGEQMYPALGRALTRFAELDIAAVAKHDFVPVIFGALRSSIHVEKDIEFTSSTVTVFVSAGGAAAPYARKVHENPRAGITGGLSPSGRRYKRWSHVGQWKYLETPAIEAATSGVGFAREAGAELDAVIRGLR